MHHSKKYLAAACAIFATTTLLFGKEIPNFELYNKLDFDVYLSLYHVKPGYPGAGAIATTVRAGKKFQTIVDTTKPTIVQFRPKPSTTGRFSGNPMIGEYSIAADGYTIYLSIARRKDGKIEVYPQTGKGGLFSKIIQTTESGLSLKNNVPKEKITEKMEFYELKPEEVYKLKPN